MSDTVGQVLRATREAKGQTLEEVERVTRIRVNYLAALEADHFAALPSTAHARGFLKNYAQHLGLDTDQLAAAYDAQQRKRSLLPLRIAPPRPAAPVPPRRARGNFQNRPPQVRVRRPRFLSADVLVATVITLVLVALLVWGGTQLASGLAAAATASVGAPAGTLDPAAATAAALVTPTVRALPTATPVLPTPAASYSGVNVTVSAELRSWVSVKVDGAETFAGIMPPGETRDFVGLNVVEVTTGNGKGTRVIFNGVDQGLLGELGEVAIRLWTEGGMLFPTPTVAPTAEN